MGRMNQMKYGLAFPLGCYFGKTQVDRLLDWYNKIKCPRIDPKLGLSHGGGYYPINSEGIIG